VDVLFVSSAKLYHLFEPEGEIRETLGCVGVKAVL
jgi:hypothetical protein